MLLFWWFVIISVTQTLIILFTFLRSFLFFKTSVSEFVFKCYLFTVWQRLPVKTGCGKCRGWLHVSVSTNGGLHVRFFLKVGLHARTRVTNHLTGLFIALNQQWQEMWLANTKIAAHLFPAKGLSLNRYEECTSTQQVQTCLRMLRNSSATQHIPKRSFSSSIRFPQET